MWQNILRNISHHTATSFWKHVIAGVPRLELWPPNITRGSFPKPYSFIHVSAQILGLIPIYCLYASGPKLGTSTTWGTQWLELLYASFSCGCQDRTKAALGPPSWNSEPFQRLPSPVQPLPGLKGNQTPVRCSIPYIYIYNIYIYIYITASNSDGGCSNGA